MLRKEDCVLLVLDVQGTLFRTMLNRNAALAASLKMIEFAGRIGIPVLVTEQYPKGLGPSLPQILSAAGAAEVIPKTSFSCFGEEAFAARLRATGRKTVMIVGMEAHICVMQTVLDGLREGYRMYLAADAVSAFSEFDRRLAFERMRAAGAIIGTVETAMFELLRAAKTDDFERCFDLLKR
jgi:hypothetical protein